MNILEEIKKKGANNEEISISLKKLKIPLTQHDKKAIQLIELLSNDKEMNDPTVSDILEVLHHASVWLELLQILNNSEN